MNSRFHLLILLIFLSACSGGVEKTNQDEDYFQFTKLELYPYDLPFSIMIPNASSGIGTALKPEVHHQIGDFKWEIQAGRCFKIFVEDYGDYKYLIEEKKKNLLNNRVYEVEIKKETDNLLVYKRRIRDDYSSLNKFSFHIYASLCIDGIYYQLSNREEGNTEEEIEFMLKSINSIKSK
ncbi:MAG: hypothetical protein RL264_883 [Bacteroidota bacterium]|jgi:hypothetical protein